MTNDQSTLQKPLRVWPALVIVILQLALHFVLPRINPEWKIIALLGGIVSSLLIIVWWLFFSRAPWKERIGAILVMALAIVITFRFIDVSIANGAMGMLFYILVIPLMCLAFAVWAAATRNLSNTTRRVTMVATIFVACGFWTLIRTGGFSGEGDNDFFWRWSQSPEEKLIAQGNDDPTLPTTQAAKPVELPVASQTQATQTSVAEAAPAPLKVEPPAEWPGFRGPNRDDIIHDVRIKTDWNANPPKEMWRRKIGPGWSSFAIRGNLIYTQEQRGEEELVSCYAKNSGKPVWRHRDSTRFWESNGGAGPRGTPAVSNGRVYALGATGILNVLNADDGSLIWKRNAASDAGTKIPGWGYSGSPLVTDDLVILSTSGRLIAYDVLTGNQRWIGPKHGTDYSSPHQLTIDKVPQILLMSVSGVTSVTPETGKLLWEHTLPGKARIVQPALTADGDVLINEGEGNGLHRLAVAKGSKGWNVNERWTSTGLKPYFSDFVVHNGYAYGFDGAFLSCIDLKDGARKWKGGHYGSGQLLLLADQDVLLILTEKGGLALVSATTDQFSELATAPAIEGKTWNHPVLVSDTLLVRNGEEMVAFKLALEDK